MPMVIIPFTEHSAQHHTKFFICVMFILTFLRSEHDYHHHPHIIGEKTNNFGRKMPRGQQLFSVETRDETYLNPCLTDYATIGA